MNGKLKPLLIIGVTTAIAIIGVCAFAMINAGDKHETKPHVHDGSHSHSAPNAVVANEVIIKNFDYGPPTIKVKVGTKVTWTNQDTVKHTVTSEESAPESFDSGLFGKGESFSYTFKAAGQYDYFCLPHTYMKGVVIVTE